MKQWLLLGAALPLVGCYEPQGQTFDVDPWSSHDALSTSSVCDASHDLILEELRPPVFDHAVFEESEGVWNVTLLAEDQPIDHYAIAEEDIFLTTEAVNASDGTIVERTFLTTGDYFWYVLYWKPTPDDECSIGFEAGGLFEGDIGFGEYNL